MVAVPFLVMLLTLSGNTVVSVSAASSDLLFSPLANDYMEPYKARGIEIPYVRFIAWHNLSTEARQNASLLGYNEQSWNMPGTNGVEQLKYDSLGEYGQTVVDTIFGLSSLNATTSTNADVITTTTTPQQQWDCYVNHYRHSTWDELWQVHDVRDHVRGLGWTYAMWMDLPQSQSEGVQSSIIPKKEHPDCYDQYWDELSTEEQNHATQLCYFSQLWDQQSLITWGFVTIDQYNNNNNNSNGDVDGNDETSSTTNDQEEISESSQSSASSATVTAIGLGSSSTLNVVGAVAAAVATTIIAVAIF
jgi:hypothetical protein